MTLDFDLSGDAAVFDHTLTLVLGQAGQADLALAGVSPFRLGQGELELLANALTAADITRGFSLPLVALAGRTPRPADTLTDPGGNVWRVQHAENSSTGRGGGRLWFNSQIRHDFMWKGLRMSYKPGDHYYGLVTTRRIDTGVMTDADSTPTAAAYHNGAVDSSFALTVTSLGSGSGSYTIGGTIPDAYQRGDVVQIVVTATVSSVTDAAPIDSFVLDSKRVGDLQDPSVAAIQSGLMSAAAYVAPDNADIAAIKAKTDNLPEQPAAAGSAMELDSSQDIYPADIEFVPNDSAGLDEYTVAWFHNGTPLTSGMTAATIEVTQRSDGTDLVAAGTAMSAVGSGGMLKYDEPTYRLAAGATAVVTVSATIGGTTRTWRRVVMRANS